MAYYETPEGHRSGYVVLAGRPNVGKSTLLNAYLGQVVAPTAPLPQTTQRVQLGILTLSDAQIIFVDTPGLHEAHHTLGEHMNVGAARAIEDGDLIVAIFDCSEPPTADDRRVAQTIQTLDPPIPFLCVVNKIDLLSKEALQECLPAFQELLPQVKPLLLSATQGNGREELLRKIVESLPEGPRYFPEAEITDFFERDIAADLIRAAGMHLLRDEVPHAIAVRIDQYKERDQHGAYIQATLFVERESQKGIVIGKGGSMIREIGTMARKTIEKMSGRKIYLKLRVKVLPGWRNDPSALQRLGYKDRSG
jgi:GTP-binding protein Era